MSTNDQTNSNTPYRLLIVEDDAGLRELIIKSLRRAGFTATGASTGGAAIAQIMAEPEQLLLLDQALPDMTGQEVLEELSKKNIRPHFILMTGHGDEQLAVEMMKLGASDYLIKNLNLIDLLPGVVKRVVTNIEVANKLQHAQLKLIESVERYEYLAAASNSVTWAVDAAGLYTFVGTSALKVFGRPAEEIVGQLHFFDLHPAEGRDTFIAEAFNSFSHHEHFVDFVNPIEHPDGKIIWVETTGAPEYDHTGKLVGYRGIDRDVSANKKAEKDLRDSEEKFSKAFYRSPLLMSISDINTGRFLEVNDAFCLKSEFTREEIIGRTSLELGWLRAEDRQALVAELQTNGQVQGLPLPLTSKSGKRIWCDYSGQIITLDNARWLLSIAQDISDRKQLEAVQSARLRLLEMSSVRSVAEIHRATLDEAEQLTGSKIGFYHHFHEAQGRIELEAWSTRTVTEFCRAEGHGRHYDLEHAGIWADAGRQRKAVVHNDFVIEPNRKGMPPGHAQVIRELVVPVLRGGQVVAILGVGNKDTPYTEQDVEAVSVLADLSWDIAVRKQAEEELRAERNLSQRYLDTVEAIIVSLDQSGHITMINRKGRELLGYQAHELIGQNWFECCIPDDGTYAYFLEIMAGRLPDAEYFENHILTRSGARRLIAWHNSYLRNDSGEMLGTLSAGEDITDRSRIEEELRGSEERYRSLYTKTPVMMHSINHAGEIISVSDYWLQTLGYAPEDLAGRKTTDFLTEESRRFATEVALPAFFRDGYCHEIPYRFVKKNGEVIDTLLSAIAERNENGAITRSLAVITDITERKRTEESLRLAKESAESANRAKSEFLANMSHELRTPMNGVLGMLQLLGITPLSDEQSEYVKLATDAGRGLVELVNDLLDLARIEVGQVELELRATNPRELLGNTCKFFMPMAAKKGLLLTEQLDDQLPVCLKLDSARLRQILFNLLGNAIKFTARGEVSCRAQLLDAAGQKQLEIVIADSGIGIAAENLSRIFEPFVQVEGTYQRSFQGAGLGLSIVKRLVSLMHGEVSLESRLGVGTTVRVTIPVTEMAAATSQPVTTVARPGTSNQACILLAEDNAINRTSMQCYLERIGYRVLGAVNGREALEQLHAHDVDLVLMDIQMPVMDGMEAFRQIRSGTGRVRNPQVPVVAMTAFAMESDRQSFLSAGMNACLTKPVDFDDLLTTIARFCAKG